MVIARAAGIGSDQACLIGFVDRRLQMHCLVIEFAAYIDVCRLAAHGEAGDQTALDQHMRIEAQDFAILAGAGLRFIGVDHEIGRSVRIGLLGHERPFEAGRKSRPAAAAQI